MKQVGEKQDSYLSRLELLEGKFAMADFPLSSTRTSDTDNNPPRPAIIIGGWDADQHHEETLHARNRGRPRPIQCLRLCPSSGTRGTRPEEGNRFLFATMSQSPERRKRAQLAGKVKRLIIEEGGDPNHIEVEFGTANLWYNSIKLASGLPPPQKEPHRRRLAGCTLAPPCPANRRFRRSCR